MAGEPGGAAFSPDGRYLACVADGKLGVYQLPDPLASLEGKLPERLKPLAQVEAAAAHQVLWPPGTNVIVVSGTRYILAPGSTPAEPVIEDVRGCACYAFEGSHLRRVFDCPEALPNVAASLDGHALVVSRQAGSTEPVVGWVSLKPGYEARHLPVKLPAEPLEVAIADDVLLFTRDIPGTGPKDYSTELLGWDRAQGRERFRLTMPAWLNLYPQELLRGYAVAGVGDTHLHHGDLVCLDCTGPCPSPVGRVSLVDLF